MSDLLRDDDLRTKREPVTEPPKRWRNRYWAGGFVGTFAMSEIIIGERLWPSKEIAVEKGHQFVAKCLADKPSIATIKYLGPFAVEGDA